PCLFPASGCARNFGGLGASSASARHICPPAGSARVSHGLSGATPHARRRSEHPSAAPGGILDEDAPLPEAGIPALEVEKAPILREKGSGHGSFAHEDVRGLESG